MMPTSVYDANQPTPYGTMDTGANMGSPVTYGNDTIGTIPSAQYSSPTGVMVDDGSGSKNQPMIGGSHSSNQIIGESITTGSSGDVVGDAVQEAVESITEGN